MANSLFSCGCQLTPGLLAMCQQTRLLWIYQNPGTVLWLLPTHKQLNHHQLATAMEFWKQQQAAHFRTRCSSYKNVLLTEERWLYHSSTPHRSHVSYAWISTQEGGPTRVHWLPIPPDSGTHSSELSYFNLIRHKSYTCTTYADMFSNVPSRTIVDFIYSSLFAMRAAHTV